MYCSFILYNSENIHFLLLLVMDFFTHTKCQLCTMEFLSYFYNINICYLCDATYWKTRVFHIIYELEKKPEEIKKGNVCTSLVLSLSIAQLSTI